VSVRCRKWVDAKGREKAAWLVDVVFEHPDGRVERVKKTSPVNTKLGAQDYERKLRAELLAGSYGKRAGPVPTLSEFAERFLTHAETNNKHSTVETKRTLLERHLEPIFGRKRLDQIGPYEIEAYKAKKIKEGLAPKSVNNTLTVLRKLLVLAVEWGVLEHVPPVKWLKAPKPDFDFLTFEEADRLITASSAEWRPMIALALNTGLRQGEILALRWDAVDLVAGRLVVKRNVWRGVEGTPKGGRSRELPLNAKALAALQVSRPASQLKSDYVFCDAKGARLTDGECKWPLWSACRRAGLRRVGWHALRHTFASHLTMRGVPLKAVQELLGHATIEMTMRYAHLSPDVKRDAVAALDRPHGPLTAHGPSATANPS
jgi:integrase